MLVTYSTYALNKLDVDPLAYALAQMETVNAGLENSKIDEVRVTLGGVVFLDVGPEYDTSATGLPLWEAIMKPYRKLYQTDLSMAITQAGGYNGKAYVFSYTSVNAWYSPTTFRHEIGHNVGGGHCNHELNDYKFGYGKTFLCGNEKPYYSNINVNDDNGQPLGDKDKADMARLWKEQSSRLVNYNPPLDGVKLLFLSRGAGKSESLRLDTSSSSAEAGFVALSADVGPTELKSVSSGGATTLTVKLKNIKNEEYPVNFRAQRAIGSCPKGIMNRNVKCNSGGGLFLTFAYYPQDNLSLPEGTYNGLLKLQAKDSSDMNYIKPINIPIALENISKQNK